jgi:sugar transferase (PEP-CTERM system associated)
MIRLLNAYFPKRTLILWIAEWWLVYSAFVAAAVVRMGRFDAGAMLSYGGDLSKILLIAVVFLASLYYFDLYESSVLSSGNGTAVRLVQVTGAACAVLGPIYYYYPRAQLGGSVFQIGILFVAILLLLCRRVFSIANSVPFFVQRTLILGDGPLAAALFTEFECRPELGVKVVGRISSASSTNARIHRDEWHEPSTESFRSISDDGLYEVLRRQHVNYILIAMDDRRGKLPVEFLLSLKSHGVRVRDGSEVYEAITGKIPIESIRLSLLLFSPGFHVSRIFITYKRVASVLVSMLALALSLPLVPFIVVAVAVSSPGPILYRQKRVGRDGTTFNCYKFRSMCADAEADIGPTWASDDDPRITRIGKWLRKSRMDEIPQLWNVLRGDMSIVGPRPERPEFVEALVREVPYYQFRHAIRPGITGWSQVRYKYGSSVEDSKEKLRYDLFYLKNMSPGLDFLILLETVKIVLWGRGAK